MAAEPLGVGEGCRAAHHLGRPGGVDAEPARRIGDVQVDLGLVPAEPVVLGAGRFERGVERRQVGRLGRVDAGGDHVDGRRAREHGAVDVVAAVEEVLLEGERAHAVAEQHDAGCRGTPRGPSPSRRHVVDQRRPTRPRRGRRGGRRRRPCGRVPGGRWRTRRSPRRRAPRRAGRSGRRARPSRGRSARRPSGRRRPPSGRRRPASPSALVIVKVVVSMGSPAAVTVGADITERRDLTNVGPAALTMM